MKITDLISRKSIKLGASPKSKEDIISEAVDIMSKGNNINDKEKYKKAVLAREAQGTTGVGEGVAIPHAKSSAVTSPGLAAMTIPEGTDYKSLDGEPTKLIFLIAAPEGKNNVHLEILSKLSTMLMNSKFIDDLVNSKSEDEFLEIIDKEERKRDEKEKKDKTSNKKPTKNKPYILAVTGCPTGIAHTYMAAEALQNKAGELDIEMKVETRGSGGAKNVLTDEEIEKADGIIIASDTQVPMDRFDGKLLYETQVSDGISKPDVLIKKILNKETSVYKGKKESGSSNSSSKQSGGLGHSIYRHLMNGVSHMLPFVVGGGILIAIAFLIDGFLIDIGSLGADERANFGSITEYAALFKNIGGIAFGFMLPVLAGYISMSISDRPGLAVGFVGGAIAAAGNSGFLGALAAGFLAGFVVKFLIKATEKFPKSIDGIRAILIYPLFGILIIGLLMFFAIEPFVGAINTGLNNALNSMGETGSVILGMILGGMMAIDMGGPFNKAAYVFGTASIASQNYEIMAAVMIGGMVPPAGIAIASWLFPNKFTKTEKQSAPANLIMGLSFITEGAIPFAAADPLRVIPASIAGSAVAGGLSMLFHSTLMAPHGGIFVFPVVGNAPMYLVSLLAGVFVTAILLGLLKKKVD